MEIKSVWVVRAYRNVNDGDAVYTHAFATKAEALEIYGRGTIEVPALHWEIRSMNYGYMDFAHHLFDLLKEEETV